MVLDTITLPPKYSFTKSTSSELVRIHISHIIETDDTPEPWSTKRMIDTLTDPIHYGALTETILSPTKYAVFQAIGCASLRQLDMLGSNISLSAFMGVGARGGVCLILVFLYLFFVGVERHRVHSRRYPCSIPRPNSPLCIILKEIAWSGVAAFLGALPYRKEGKDFAVLFAAGLIGPLPSMFLVVVFGVLVTIVKDARWYMRY